ncbi:MAG TPA: hypothetical protein VFK13_05365 [Gemmatimonadaceae bacterium]|nr:hypothetical protein [Gemmatimonadaceae bacterium]
MRGIVVLLWFATATVLQAQGQPTPKVFIVRQTSWWAADGLPAWDVVARDSTFVFRFDGDRVWPATGTLPVAWGVAGDDEPRPSEGTLLVNPDGTVRGALMSSESVRCEEGWPNAAASSLAAMGLSLLTPVRESEDAEASLPTLTLTACGDSVTLSASRHAVRTGPMQFLQDAITLKAAWSIERQLVQGGVRVHADMSGTVSGPIHIDSAGVLQSGELDVFLRGLMTYDEPGGATDTIYGHWRARLHFTWADDPSVEHDRMFAYFVEHGRYPPSATPDTAALSPVEELAQRGDTSAAALDSLLRWRLRTTEPAERMEIDRVLPMLGAPLSRLLAWAGQSEAHRIAPEWMLSALRYQPERTGPYGHDAAAVLRTELAPRLTLRRRLTDRERLLPAAVAVLATGRGFDSTEGPLFLSSAMVAGDPMVRDLLVLAAYQSDPARYAATVRARVDSVHGYGPIVLSWLDGNGSAMSEDWGVDDAGTLHDKGFPGIDAPVEDLERFLNSQPGWRVSAALHVRPQVGGLAALQMRARAEGWDLGSRLRERFRRLSDPAGRVVLAEYLTEIGDSIANPFLRSLLDRRDSLAMRAYELLPRDTVQDEGIVADLQRRAIAYIAGRGTFTDTSGNAIRPPWVHNERPDTRILVSTNVLPSAQTSAASDFQVLSQEALEERVAREGLQMAWYIEPVTRTGNRFYLNFALSPVGAPCLCGGGVKLALERRGEEWVVVSVSMWIS